MDQFSDRTDQKNNFSRCKSIYFYFYKIWPLVKI